MTRKNLTQLKEEVDSTIPPEAIAVPLSNDKVNASQHHALLGNVLDSVSLISETQSPVIPHHPTIKATVGVPLSVTLNAARQEGGQTYLYRILGAPDWLSFNNNTRNLTGTPPQNSEGRYDITYRVIDSSNPVNVNYADTITIVVAIAPDPPIAVYYNNGDADVQTIGSTRFVLNFPAAPLGQEYTYRISWGKSDNFTATNITAEGFQTTGLGLFVPVIDNPPTDRDALALIAEGPLPAITYILTGTRA